MMLGTTGLLLTLGLLALIDATSIGTLVIPLWLVLRTKARGELWAAVLYLGVVAGFYLLVGLFILGGASRLNEVLTEGLFNSPILRWAALAAGAGMLTWAILARPAKSQTTATNSTKASVPGRASIHGPSMTAGETSRPAVVSHGPDRTDSAEGRWQGRIDRALSSRVGIVVLGLSAGLLELPTMLPYLGAIGLLTQSGHAMPIQTGLLVAYCLVMIVPGLAVIGLRAIAGARMQRSFGALSGKLASISGESLVWVVGIVGFLLLRSSLGFLFPEAGWNPFK